MQKKDIRNPLTIVSYLLIKAPYKPTGDQPQAIAELVKGFKEGNQCQTLLRALKKSDSKKELGFFIISIIIEI